MTGTGGEPTATQPVLWVDATRGVAGDMLLGALIDAGADLDAVRASIGAAASAIGEAIQVEATVVRRHGLRATRISIDVGPSSTVRGLDDVLGVTAAAGLSPAADRFARAVFVRLADAEAAVHGVDRSEVHFHEVGALDSIADVVGCARALEDLGLLGPDVVRTVSEVALGGGTARTGHGVVPVPVPATLALLAGAPVTAGYPDRELCTPTGAALLAELATGWGSLPAMVVAATGTGAGGYDPPDRPNVTRAVVGRRAVAHAGWQTTDLLVVEATVDDLDPRVWPDVLDAVHQAGAADAWLSPVLMRHGRPGQVLTALARPDVVDAVFGVLARMGVSLGARLHPVQRRHLPRDSVTVEVDGFPIQVKRGLLDGAAVTWQPEYSDAQAAARATGRSVSDVIDRARSRARDGSSALAE